MARRSDLEKFAREHGFKIGTIADLIRYRLQNEHTIERVAEAPLHTEFGEFKLVTYQDSVDNTVHLAMVRGAIQPGAPTLVRVHIRNTLSDVLGAERRLVGMACVHFLISVRIRRRIARKRAGCPLCGQTRPFSRRLTTTAYSKSSGGTL